MEQRDNCKALLQKMEEEHLETITKMKRRIDDLEGMLNKVFAYIYSVQVVMTEKNIIFNPRMLQLASTDRFYLQFAKQKN